MRRKVVNFRAEPELVEAMRTSALRDGVTVSEAIRSAVREAVNAAHEAAGVNDPYHMLAAAADGNLDALRSMVAIATSKLFHNGDIIAGIEGLVFARLAAVKGDVDDTRRLLHLLNEVREVAEVTPECEYYADELGGEIVAQVSLLADSEVEGADAALVELARQSNPRIMEIATEIEDRMKAAEGVNDVLR
jgi:hypothetical protein